MPDTATAAPGQSFTHQALIYDTDAQFLTHVLDFTRTGLALAEPVFISTTPRMTSLLRRALGPQTARVEFAPAQGSHDSPAQTLLDYRDRSTAVPGHTRVLSETFATTRARDQAGEWTRYEALLNLALATSGAWILCPYDSRHLPGHLLHSARLTHPYLSQADSNGNGTVASNGAMPSNPAYTDPHLVSASCDIARWTPHPLGAADFPFHRTDQLARLRLFAAHHARAIGIGPEQVNALLVSVVEAAANTLCHGAGRGTCRIWNTSTELLCDITDPNGTLDPTVAGYLPPLLNRPDGRGLWIIRQLCDAVEIHTAGQGSTIRLHLTLPAQPSRPVLRSAVPGSADRPQQPVGDGRLDGGEVGGALGGR